MRQYLDLLEKIIAEGDHKNDRTGTGTLSIFGTQQKYDLTDNHVLEQWLMLFHTNNHHQT